MWLLNGIIKLVLFVVIVGYLLKGELRMKERLAFWLGLAAVLGAIYLLFNPPSARSQELIQGRGLFCDTAEQVERFVLLNTKGNPRQALVEVNAEFQKDDACILDQALLYQGKTVKTLKDHNGKLWDISEVYVVAIASPQGWVPAQVVWWSAFPSKNSEI